MKAITAATVGLAATAATAATANAATLSLDPVKQCYLSGTSATISGTGFTPGGGITVTAEGAQPGHTVADTAGSFAATWNFGGLHAVKSHLIVATDDTNPATKGSVSYVGTTQQVALKDTRGKPGKKKKLRGYGFIFGKKAFMHVRGHGIKTNTFLKRVKAPCGTFVVKKAFVHANAPVGLYRVQFDHKKSYKKHRAGSIAYQLSVFRTFSSTAFGGAGWSLTPIAG
jgi:phospholipase/lecithinase/hemolysin